MIYWLFNIPKESVSNLKRINSYISRDIDLAAETLRNEFRGQD